MLTCVSIFTMISMPASPIPMASVQRMAAFLMCPFVISSNCSPSTVTAGSESVIATPRTKPSGTSSQGNQSGRAPSKNTSPMYLPANAKPKSMPERNIKSPA